MRILHTVEFYEPSKGGAQEVVKQLSERLAARGHQVAVATSFQSSRLSPELNGVAIHSFNVRGNTVKGFSGEYRRYAEFLVDSEFDVVMNYAAQTWTTDLTFSVLRNLKGKKVIAPVGYSRLYDKRYQQYFLDLPRYLTQFDRLVYTSSNYQDKRFGDQNGLSEKGIVISNGASLEEFSQPPLGFRERYGIRTRYMFLTVSNHYFAKGHRAVIDAFRGSGVSDATLVIIGDRPSLHSWYSCFPLCAFAGVLDSSVRVLTDVPRPWVVSAFQEADLFLFGSRIECAPLVMYECFASKTPMISTPVGNVGDHRDLVTVVQNPEEMRSQMKKFVADPATLTHRAGEARKAFEAGFSWNHITSRFEELYESL